jgi:hypothetical protein
VSTNRLEFEYQPGSVNQSAALIYLWEIFDNQGGRYGSVGKAGGGAYRPLHHYHCNVNNLLAGKPYRKSKPDKYRKVHRRLADAVLQGWQVRLRLLCNVSGDDDISSVEREWQKRFDIDTLPERFPKEPPTQ